MKILDRVETRDYIENLINNNKRVIVSRYNDGEYMIMKLKKNVANTKSNEISDLLIKSISVKGQLVCVNFLKEHNIEKKDIWYDSHIYLTETGKQDLYGCGNYCIHDFLNGSNLLKKFFIGKVLLVCSLVDESKEFFKDSGLNIDFYKTDHIGSDLKYLDIKNDLFKICKKYDNIIFSSGPISKVLISDLVNKCKSNLIDFGAMLNALLNLPSLWHMSWLKDVNIDEKIKMFKENLFK